MAKDDLAEPTDKGDTPASRLLSRRYLGTDETSGATLIAYSAIRDFTNRHGTVQGGLLAAMLDSATAFTLISSLPEDATAVTKRITIDYLRPAYVGEFVARVTCGPRDSRDATMEAKLSDEDGNIVAKAIAELWIKARP